MSDINSVLERVRRAYAAIGEIENVAARTPGDRFVVANLESLKSDAQELEKQWEDECRIAQIEICRYRIVPEHTAHYSLSSVSRSLLDFQEMFSQIYDALKKGRKTRARISAEVAAETKFDFGFTYPGSLGVALMVPSESQFWESKFDDTVKAIGDVISIDDQDDVRDVAKNLGGAVVTKVYDWSRVNFGAGFGVDITWKRLDGTLRGGMIDTSSMGKVVDLIARTSDRRHRRITIKGVLVGINVKTRRFRFVQHDGPDYIGVLDEDFPITRQWAVNRNYTATLLIESIMKYSTMDTKTTYKLEALKEQKSA